MVVLPNDIRFFYSGGTDNQDPLASLGGQISTTQIINSAQENVFNNVTLIEADNGMTDYRCFYVKNVGAELWRTTVIWREESTQSGFDGVFIGIGSSIIDGTEQLIVDRFTAPLNVNFASPDSKESALQLGDLAPGSRKSMWIKRVVQPLARTFKNNTFKLRVELGNPAGGGTGGGTPPGNPPGLPPSGGGGGGGGGGVQCQTGYHAVNGVCIPDTVPPITGGGGENILWQSTAWSNGRDRTLTSSGQRDPDDPTLSFGAGENRELIIKGASDPGFVNHTGARTRIYVDQNGTVANNYNASLEIQKFYPNASLDGLSLRLRSRHNESGDGANRFGGYGMSLHNTNVEAARENFHNDHTDLSPSTITLPQPLVNGTEYGVRFSVRDTADGKVECKLELKGGTYGTTYVEAAKAYDNNPSSYMLDKQLYINNKSYFWIRTNGSAPEDVRYGFVVLRDLDKQSVTTCPAGYTLKNGLCVANTLPPPGSGGGGTQPPPSGGGGTTIADYTATAVGDTTCGSTAQTITSRIIARNPNFHIPLGDYTYTSSTACWLSMMAPLKSKIFSMNIGNHDDEEDESNTLRAQYLAWVGLAQPYHAFTFRNTFVLTLYTYAPFGFGNGSAQFTFAQQQLAAARANPAIDWIIVNFHKPIYTAASNHSGYTAFRDVYHPLFDQYKVDLCLSGHVHNYQRTKPLTYTGTGTGNSIANNQITGYINLVNPIFAIVGCGGREISSISSVPSYNGGQREGYGYLLMSWSNNGKKLTCRHYDQTDTLRDEWTMDKTSVSQPPPPPSGGGGTTPPPPPPPTTGGQIDSNGIKWFLATGQQSVIGNSRYDKSGPENDFRWSEVYPNLRANGYEATAYGIFETTNGDAHFALKHWGGNHSGNCQYEESGSCCCFPAGYKVDTIDGLKPIEQVKVGDMVYTHKGRYKKVVKLYKHNYNREVYSLQTYGTSNYEVTATHSHKFLTKDRGWIKIEDLTKNDWLMFPINRNVVDKEYISIPVNGSCQELQLKLEKELLTVIGYYLAEGCIKNDGVKSRSISFTFSSKECDINHIQDLVNSISKLGFNPRRYNREKDNACSIEVHSTGLSTWIYNEFGHGAKNKKLPQWIINLPIEKLRVIFEAYMNGDACTVVKGKHLCRKVKSVSENLIYDMRKIALKLGYKTSIYKEKTKPKGIIQGRLVNQNTAYVLYISEISGHEYNDQNKSRQLKRSKEFKYKFNTKIRLDSDYQYQRIRGIEQKQFTGIVYDFEVEEDHSFLVNGIITKNCWYDTGIRENGNIQLQIERPHPSNDDFNAPITMNNIGVGMSNNTIGLKWIIYPIVEGGDVDNGGVKIKMWVDTSGFSAGKPQNQWRLVYDITDTGQILGDYPAPEEQEIEVRNSDTDDTVMYAGGIHWRRLSRADINAGGTSGGGGTTPPPSSPAQPPTNVTYYYDSTSTQNTPQTIGLGNYDTTENIIGVPEPYNDTSVTISGGYIRVEAASTGLGRIFVDYYKKPRFTQDNLPGFNTICSMEFVYAGQASIIIVDGNSPMDNDDLNTVFGGFELFIAGTHLLSTGHQQEASVNVRYYSDPSAPSSSLGRNGIRSSPGQYPYPGGRTLQNGNTYKVFYSCRTNKTDQTVVLNAWMDFGDSAGWVKVVENYTWDRISWLPGAVLEGYDDSNQVIQGPDLIQRHRLAIRNSNIDIGSGTDLQVRNIKIGTMPYLPDPIIVNPPPSGGGGTQPPPDNTNPPSGTGGNDGYGIKMIYPTKASGDQFLWDLSGTNSRIAGQNVTSTRPTAGGPWSFQKNSTFPMRIYIYTKENSTSNINTTQLSQSPPVSTFNHNSLATLGYFYQARDWKNIEYTVYISTLTGAELDPQTTFISLIARSANHTTTNGGCGGSSYHADFNFQTGGVRFKKEQYHSAYVIDPFTATNVGSAQGKYVGLKFVIWNRSSDGKVEMELWIDKDANNNWVKYIGKIDNDDWGTGAAQCAGTPPGKKITWGSPITILKMDSPSTLFASYISVREITPPS